MSSKNAIYFSMLFLLIGIYACTKVEPAAPSANSVMNSPFEDLTYSQNILFNSGAEEFDENYTTETGLGPIFVSTSCASCHAEDNRGHISLGLIRFGQTDTLGNTYLHNGGPQIQNRALFGYTSEILPDGVPHSRLLAPIVAGIGLLENVPELTLLNLSDPFDSNSDGISGRPNWVNLPSWVQTKAESISNSGKFLCRFGRKASAYNVFQQTAQAFNQDLGITTEVLPVNPGSMPTSSNFTPDISNESLEATVFYLQALQAPLRRNEDDPLVILGESIFNSIGCESCHKSTLTTGPSVVAGLNYKTIHPYTDLLLHDMGAGLDDGYTEGTAMTYEWRTTPLWGLGLARDAQGGSLNLLHDGRAHSIEDAIQYHGGEGSASVNMYNSLNADERKALITFLESL